MKQSYFSCELSLKDIWYKSVSQDCCGKHYQVFNIGSHCVRKENNEYNKEVDK